MRRFLACLLAVLFLFLSACSSPSVEHHDQDSEKSQAPTAESEAVFKKDQASDAIANPGNNDTSSVSDTTEPPRTELPVFKKTVLLEETILYSENDIVITATSLEYSNYAVEIGITIENNSTETYDFTSGYQHIVANGYMYSGGYMNCSVEAGKKARDSILLEYDTLMICGIYELTDLSIGFTITDDDYNKTFVEPAALTLSNAGDPSANDLSYQKAITNPATQAEFGYKLLYFSDDIIYDQNNISIVSQTLIRNQYDEVVLMLEVKNSSQDLINFRVGRVIVNELVIFGSNNWTTDLILPGTTNLVGITLSSLISDSYWELYGLETICTLGLDVGLYDYEYDEIAATITISIPISSEAPSFDTSGETIHSDNGINIIFKGIIDGEDTYDDDVYILLLVENTRDIPITFDEKYDSFSINGYMSDCSMYSSTIEPGQWAMVEIQIYEYMFEESGITKAADIEFFEITFELRNDSYHKLDTFTVQYPKS